jgi:hypothetical protein
VRLLTPFHWFNTFYSSIIHNGRFYRGDVQRVLRLPPVVRVRTRGLLDVICCTSLRGLNPRTDPDFDLVAGKTDTDPEAAAPAGGSEEKGRRNQVLTDQAFEAVTAEYKSLVAAMEDASVRDASGGLYSQPWKHA